MGVRLVGETDMPVSDLLELLCEAGADAARIDGYEPGEGMSHPVLIRKGRGSWVGCDESDLLDTIMQGEVALPLRKEVEKEASPFLSSRAQSARNVAEMEVAPQSGRRPRSARSAQSFERRKLPI